MVSSKMSKFLINQLILTASVYLVGFFLFKFFFLDYFYSFLAYLPLIFFVLYGVLYYTILNISGKQMKSFTTRFMGVFGIKIIILLVFIVLYSFFNPDVAVQFLIIFFILYVIYTIHGVVAISGYFKKQ